MGFAGKMKRKFSLSTLQTKSSAQHDEIRDDYDTDSPPYSPTPSEMERPSFHPQLLYDLRVACADLVNQTNPPDPDDEPEHQETLKKVEAQRKAKYVAQAQAAEARSQKAQVRELKSKPRREESQKEPPKRYSSTRPREDVRKPERKAEPAQASEPQHYVPKHDPSAVNAIAGQRRPSGTAKIPETGAVEPVPTEAPSRPREQRQQTEDDVLNEIRRSIHSRPKTSAAACVDYDGPNEDDGSSKSTSRSTSNYDALHRPTSTGLTSLAHTPGEEKRRSHFRRPSDESYQEELAREKAAWLKDQQAKRDAEQYSSSGRAARPASRTSKLSRMTSRSELSDRPPSRAGSFASSIADGISNYIRPRSSSEGFRSGRSSVMGLSRSHSRSSSMSRRSSSGFWRRNSLRRKGSWASFRSSRPDHEERSTKRNGEPNLNRPLPALPGLDQYKESKIHIGQMMKGGGKKKKLNKKSISDPKPLVNPDTEYTATLPKPATPILDRAMQMEEEERAYQAEMQRQQRQLQEHHRHSHSHKHHHEHHRERHHDHPRRSTVPKDMESSHRSHKDKSENKRNSRSKHPPRRSTVPVLAVGPEPDPRQHPYFSNQIHNPESRSGSLSKSPTNLSNNFVHPLSPTVTNGSQLHNAPPIIRGPSYKKELEAGVYPRPMDVNNGTGVQFPTNYHQYYDVRLVDVGPRARQSRMGWDYEKDREDERKGGIKGKMGRMFGSNGGAGGAGGAGGRRTMIAT